MHELVDAMDVKLAAKGNYMSGKQGKDKKRDENRSVLVEIGTFLRFIHIHYGL